jgi:predicted nucleic acid-binding protein
MSGIDFIVDTNFLIFVSDENKIVLPFLEYNIAVSYITEMELLGVFSISKNQKLAMEKILNQCYVIDCSKEIKELAIKLKQKYKIKLPDAIIAATAIDKQLPFVSADSDFKVIKELDLIFLER